MILERAQLLLIRLSPIFQQWTQETMADPSIVNQLPIRLLAYARAIKCRFTLSAFFGDDTLAHLLVAGEAGCCKYDGVIEAPYQVGKGLVDLLVNVILLGKVEEKGR